jgi:hypothetical protein
VSLGGCGGDGRWGVHYGHTVRGLSDVNDTATVGPGLDWKILSAQWAHVESAIGRLSHTIASSVHAHVVETQP